MAIGKNESYSARSKRGIYSVNTRVSNTQRFFSVYFE